MSTGPSPLAHRTVSSIRAGGASLPREAPSSPSSPHTPLRAISSAIGSPSSSGRSEDEAIIIELGTRKARVGFAGDSVPKRIITVDPEQSKRAGDFRSWAPGYEMDWRARGATQETWTRDYEFWQLDIRGQDLALIGDKLECGLRDAFTKHLLTDSKPRKISLVLPPEMPLPILSSILDMLFHRFQSPTVSLFSSPVMATFAAGIRSALVIDIGWNETLVTGVYEYRQVSTLRTVRASKMLIEETRNFLVSMIEDKPVPEGTREPAFNGVVSFGDCEEVATRMLWCKRAHNTPEQDSPEGLPTLHEQDESETADPAEDTAPARLVLNSCKPPRTIRVPFARLAEPCESTFFQTKYSPVSFDDDEWPLHLVIYQSLLQLPIDVRAMCMSRIILIGGCSHMIGLRGRILDELSRLVQERGWNPIRGKGVDAWHTNPSLEKYGMSVAGISPSRVPATQAHIQAIQTHSPRETAGEVDDTSTTNPAFTPLEKDQVEELIRRDKNWKEPTQGELRAIDSMGPWCGASLATQLKVPALAMVDRDMWMQQGVSGASRPSDVDIQQQTKQPVRQGLGGGNLARGQGGQVTNWTLGIWGTLD